MARPDREQRLSEALKKCTVDVVVASVGVPEVRRSRSGRAAVTVAATHILDRMQEGKG